MLVLFGGYIRLHSNPRLHRCLNKIHHVQTKTKGYQGIHFRHLEFFKLPLNLQSGNSQSLSHLLHILRSNPVFLHCCRKTKVADHYLQGREETDYEIRVGIPDLVFLNAADRIPNQYFDDISDSAGEPRGSIDTARMFATFLAGK